MSPGATKLFFGVAPRSGPELYGDRAHVGAVWGAGAVAFWGPLKSPKMEHIFEQKRALNPKISICLPTTFDMFFG